MTEPMEQTDQNTRETIKANIQGVRKSIQEACGRANRDPSDVQLCAVTKTRPAEAIQILVEEGVKTIGENRVQEAERKYQHLPDECRLHLIGHLQSNKTSLAVRLFSAVQSVDRPKIIDYLQRHCEKRDLRMPVFVQVNASGESSKFGVDPDEVEPVLNLLSESDALIPEGFMTMAPYVDDPEQVRPVFKTLREVRDQYQKTFTDLQIGDLSMGMTQDYQIAIEEGATMVRIGRGLFEGTPWA